jgi:uncharacterized membrane protein YkoI
MNRINRIVLSTITFLALRANAGETMVEKRSNAAPRFTLEQAILTALQQNPNIMIARQEIERTLTAKGEPRYEVRYRGPDGRERSRTFRTREAAEAYNRAR